MKEVWVGYNVGCTVGFHLGHSAWQIDQFPTCWPMNGLFVHWSRGWGVSSFSERLVSVAFWAQPKGGQVNGLAQDFGSSSASSMQLPQSNAKPLKVLIRYQGTKILKRSCLTVSINALFRLDFIHIYIHAVFALSAGPRPSATKNWAEPASFPFGPASFSSFSCLKIFKDEFRAGKFWNLNAKTVHVWRISSSYVFIPLITFPFNSLWHSDTIWRHRSGLTLTQLMAPSHYLNQCWLNIKCVLWHSPESNFIKNAHEFNP